jgi:hypothetical protein
LFEEVAGGRRGCDGDADGVFETFGALFGAEEGVYSRCGVEMGYFFFFEEIPNERVVYFAKAVIRSADSSNSPAKRPA